MQPRTARRGERVENAVQFPDHPWQLKAPSSTWYFADKELEPAIGPYRVGHLQDPRPDDPHIPTVEQALIVALGENALLAVWSDDDAIVCIVYEGRAYWP